MRGTCPRRTRAPACSPAPCWACCLALPAHPDLGRCRQRAPPRLPPQPPHGGRTAGPRARSRRRAPHTPAWSAGRQPARPRSHPDQSGPAHARRPGPRGNAQAGGAPWAALPAAAGPALRRSAAAGSAARPAVSLSTGRSPAPSPAGPRSQAPRAPPSVGTPAPGCAAAGNALASSAFGCRSGLPRCPSAPRGAAALPGS